MKLVRNDATEHVSVIPKPIGVIRVKRSEYEARVKDLQADIAHAYLCGRGDEMEHYRKLLATYKITGNSYIPIGLTTIEIIEG